MPRCLPLNRPSPSRAAYTVDGSTRGELTTETFSGAEVTMTIEGVEVHPGFAYGRLVNAGRLAAQVLAELPSDRLTPETTQGREGYLHPFEIDASAGRATVRWIARDFDDELLEQHAELVRTTAERVVAAEPRAKLDVAVVHQYPNMRTYLDPYPEIVAAAERAFAAEGIEPLREPIRGGTDGSRLSQMGLPTPNLFAGGHEFHSVREWVAVQDLAAAAAVLVRLAEAWVAQPAT
jgi:tripeptide aminopeptidase